MMDELVSIIVPVYNAEKFMRETIDTVLDQTYKYWELLLVNECSTDNSKNIKKRKERALRRRVISTTYFIR